MRVGRLAAWVLLLVVMAGAFPREARAQAAAGPVQVVSANPFGLLFELFNAEYERKVASSLTSGIGGSHYRSDGDDYLNWDVFLRYYPAGRPLDGFAFGVKAGFTSQGSEGPKPGVGFDANYSWLLGAREHFYVGLGFGLKRVFGDDRFGVKAVPTVRFVNVGVAF